MKSLRALHHWHSLDTP
uniref:Uncharacterized protein n=1 Tax=Rhizophora mucronata TaxID=61149 RepID=A0A2P2QF78_RHIMU